MSSCHQPNPSDRKDVTAKPAIPDLETPDVERAIDVAVSRTAAFHTLTSSAKACVLASTTDILTNAFVGDFCLCLERLRRMHVGRPDELEGRNDKRGIEKVGVDGMHDVKKIMAVDREGWRREVERKAKRVRSEDSCSTMSDPELERDALMWTGKHDGAMIRTSVHRVGVDNETERKAEDGSGEGDGKALTKSSHEREKGVKGVVAKMTDVSGESPPFKHERVKLDFDVAPNTEPDGRGNTVIGAPRVGEMVLEGENVKRTNAVRKVCSSARPLMEAGAYHRIDDNIIVDGTNVGDKAAIADDGAHALSEASADETTVARTRTRPVTPRTLSSAVCLAGAAEIAAANAARAVEPTPNNQNCFTAGIFATQETFSGLAALAAERTIPTAEISAASPANTLAENHVLSAELMRQYVRLTGSHTRSLPTNQSPTGRADLTGPFLKKNRRIMVSFSQTKAETSLSKGNRSNVKQELIPLEVEDELKQDISRLGETKLNQVKRYNDQWNEERTEKARKDSLKEEQWEGDKTPEREEIEKVETEAEKQKDERRDTNDVKEKGREARKAIIPGDERWNTWGWCGKDRDGQEMRGRGNRKKEMEGRQFEVESRKNMSKEKSATRKQRGKAKLKKVKVEKRKREEQGGENGDYEGDPSVYEMQQTSVKGKMAKMVTAQAEDDANIVIKEGLEDLNLLPKARAKPSRSRGLRNSGHIGLPWWRTVRPGISRAIQQLNDEEAFRGLICAMIRSSLCESWSADNLREQYHQNPSSSRGRAFLAVTSSLLLMERAKHMGQCRLKWKRQLIVELSTRRDIEWSVVQGDLSFPHFVGCEACQKFRRATRRIRLAGPKYDSRDFWPSCGRISVLSAKHGNDCIEVTAELDAGAKRFPHENNVANDTECELFVDAECLRKCLVFHELVHSTAILAEDIRLMIESELSDGTVKFVRENEDVDKYISDCLARHLIDVLSQNTEFLKGRTTHFIDLVKLGNIYFSASDAEVLDSGAGIKSEVIPQASRIYDAPIELNDDEHIARVHNVESLTKKKSLITSFATLC